MHHMQCGVCLEREIGAHYIPGLGEFLACAVCHKPLCEGCVVLRTTNEILLPFCPQHDIQSGGLGGDGKDVLQGSLAAD